MGLFVDWKLQTVLVHKLNLKILSMLLRVRFGKIGGRNVVL